MASSEQAQNDTQARRKQMRSTIIAAASNLSTAYNLVNINLAHVEMENQYCGGDNCKSSVTAASTACLVGAIVGQLTFGYVGDCLGRSCALQLTMVLTILGALLSAFAVPLDPNNQASIFTFLSITRLIMGVGVGGVYPLAATIAAESSNSQNRGSRVSLVFSMQGVGTLLVPVMGMVFMYNLGTWTDRAHDGEALPGIGWRLILGVGALPGLLLMPFNRPPRNPPALTEEALAARSARSVGGESKLLKALKNRRYWGKLAGCAGGWFLFDITFYGNTLFAPTVLKTVFHQGSSVTPTLGSDLDDNLCWQLAILALIGLPGYFIAMYFMDSMGRKKIQLMGFMAMAILYAALGMFIDKLKQNSALLMIVYGLTYFFSNFGPNSTTFILPSESFPEEVRSTLNGFCAASGKLGAVVGSAAFKPVVNSAGVNTAFFLCAICSIMGVGLTAVFVEDRRGRAMSEGGSTTGSFVDTVAAKQLLVTAGEETSAGPALN